MLEGSNKKKQQQDVPKGDVCVIPWGGLPGILFIQKTWRRRIPNTLLGRITYPLTAGTFEDDFAIFSFSPGGIRDRSLEGG